MEKYITIPTSDGFEIRGILNQREDTDRLIIFVHGFTWSTNEAHYVWARDYFIEKWYATFRFSLYHGSDSCRKLHTTTVNDHSYDVQRVIDFFWSTYTELFLVWHSLGWPTIIWVPNLKVVRKIILWDPALEMKSSAEKVFKEGEKYFTSSGSGKNIQVWEAMLEEFRTVDYFKKLENMPFRRNDIGVVYASEDRHIKFKAQIDDIWIKNYVIQGADHCFTREWDLEALFEKTLEFIEK